MQLKSLILLCTMTGLTACGGSSNNNTSNSPQPNPNPVPNPETNPKPATCNLTYENWEKIKQKHTLTEVESILGCKGSKVNDTQVEYGTVESSYAWGDIEKGPYIVAGFNSNSLKGKTFIPARQTNTSCFPTNVQINNLATGQELNTVQTNLGCAGIHTQSISIEDGTVESAYSWGKATERLLLIKFKNGKLTSYGLTSTQTTVSQCEPSKTNWDKINTGDSYERTVESLGCEGVLSSITTVNDIQKISYLWGNTLNQNLALVSFVNNKVTEKAFTPNPSIPASNCVISDELWKSFTLAKTTYNDVKAAVGCEGTLQGSTDVGVGAARGIYIWGDNTKDYSALTFENNILSSKSLSHSQAKSACIPTQAQFDQVAHNQNFEVAKKAFSCEPALVSMIQVIADVPVQYSYGWGLAGQTNYAMLNVSDNVVTSKTYLPK